MFTALHPEGVPLVRRGTVLLGLWVAVGGLLWGWAWPLAVWVVPALGVWVWVISFFRNPPRSTPANQPDVVFAPCDGKVVALEPVTDPHPALPGRWQQLSIFMSPFNVHQTRHPMAGTVQEVAYQPGRFFPAYVPKSSDLNEQVRVILGTDQGPIGYRMVAGVMARRISHVTHTGQAVQAGQPLGFIRFGSRMDVWLPPTWPVAARLGQHVKAGQTMLATATTAEAGQAAGVSRASGAGSGA